LFGKRYEREKITVNIGWYFGWPSSRLEDKRVEDIRWLNLFDDFD